MKRKAVLVIDMLKDFVFGKLKCERAERIIPNLQKLLEAARENDIPVIYCNDAHYPTDFEIKRWGLHALKGSEGAEVIKELEPQEKDYIIEKRVYSAFFETGLDPLLRSLYRGKGVETLILTGLHANICVRHTAADAFFRGYKIVVAKDGVEAFSEEEYKEGIDYLKFAYGAIIKSVDEIIKEFR